MLAAIVRLVTEGTQAHAAYVFIVESGGSRLVLRAASEPYNQAVGKVSMRRGEGLAGWVAEHRRPAFIPDNALADPRIKYFPELEEEKYQSIVSVPLVGKDDEVMGVIALHAEAPRVFSEDDAAFVIHSASLVASAIENARLYAAARRRVRELERLSAALGVDLRGRVAGRAAAGRRHAVAGAAARRQPCTSTSRSRTTGCGDAPPRRAPPTRRRPSGLAELSDELRRGGRLERDGAARWRRPSRAARPRRPRMTMPLSADGELIGFLVARAAERPHVRRRRSRPRHSIAAQTAVGIKKIRLIEGLEERNLIKDFFADLIAGRRREGLGGRARRLGCDLDQPKLALVVVPLARRAAQRRGGRARHRPASRTPAAGRCPACCSTASDEIARGLGSGARRRRARVAAPAGEARWPRGG